MNERLIEGVGFVQQKRPRKYSTRKNGVGYKNEDLAHNIVSSVDKMSISFKILLIDMLRKCLMPRDVHNEKSLKNIRVVISLDVNIY